METMLRPAEVAAALGIAVSTLYDWMANPTAFPSPLPQPRQIGSRAVGWPSSEIDAFIRALPERKVLPRSSRRKAAAA